MLQLGQVQTLHQQMLLMTDKLGDLLSSSSCALKVQAASELEANSYIYKVSGPAAITPHCKKRRLEPIIASSPEKASHRKQLYSIH